jgi:hypothetical protein
LEDAMLTDHSACLARLKKQQMEITDQADALERWADVMIAMLGLEVV